MCMTLELNAKIIPKLPSIKKESVDLVQQVVGQEIEEGRFGW